MKKTYFDVYYEFKNDGLDTVEKRRVAGKEIFTEVRIDEILDALHQSIANEKGDCYFIDASSSVHTNLISVFLFTSDNYEPRTDYLLEYIENISNEKVLESEMNTFKTYGSTFEKCISLRNLDEVDLNDFLNNLKLKGIETETVTKSRSIYESGATVDEILYVITLIKSVPDVIEIGKFLRSLRNNEKNKLEEINIDEILRKISKFTGVNVMDIHIVSFKYKNGKLEVKATARYEDYHIVLNKDYKSLEFKRLPKNQLRI